MSRIGNKPVAIPAGVTDVKDHTVTVKGPKGELVIHLTKTFFRTTRR